MAASSVNVGGARDLDRKLAALERGLSDRQIAAALMSGVKVIGDEERQLVPSLTGNLRDSITETMTPSNLPNDPRTAYVGPQTGGDGPDGWYGHLVEFSTVDTPAQPFARPAVDRKGETALGVVLAHLATDLKKLAA